MQATLRTGDRRQFELLGPAQELLYELQKEVVHLGGSFGAFTRCQKGVLVPEEMAVLEPRGMKHAVLGRPPAPRLESRVNGERIEWVALPERRANVIAAGETLDVIPVPQRLWLCDFCNADLPGPSPEHPIPVIDSYALCAECFEEMTDVPLAEAAPHPARLYHRASDAQEVWQAKSGFKLVRSEQGEMSRWKVIDAAGNLLRVITSADRGELRVTTSADRDEWVFLHLVRKLVKLENRLVVFDSTEEWVERQGKFVLENVIDR